MRGLFANATVADHDHLALRSNAVDDNKGEGGTGREQIWVGRELTHLQH